MHVLTLEEQAALARVPDTGIGTSLELKSLSR
ncbi:protein of unknown function [Methylocaldum szegediense]|uniref:Transposase n=1 Tax=Methylocaldum szegediense TaxID=73780 RepID=A0ABM9I283_9GAMM|nr:protein of unknown function [Methylocaldum szegediense]